MLRLLKSQTKLRNFRFRNEREKLLQCIRLCSSVTKSDVNSQRFATFDDVINQRRTESCKSLVVQVSSENSYQELYSIFAGKVNKAIHYVADDKNHFILLEFNDHSGFKEAIANSSFNEENPGVPVISPFVWLKKTAKSNITTSRIHPSVDLQLETTRPLSDTCLNQQLENASNVDDQISLLYKRTCLNDLGVRLRFILANQLESALRGMFPAVRVFPFGSSVNGMGKTGCDLDLILRWGHNSYDSRNQPEARTIFQTKASLSNERSQTQRQMETLADILHLFLPGVFNVRRILQARVPIIKFSHECLDLEVDLSTSNLTGLYMSELLYIFGEIDSRVRPLTFCVRKWASATGLTSPSPGRWISNFSLTCLVIFFLQSLEKPILPDLNFLVKHARTEDIRVADENINCTFLRDLNKLSFRTTNKDSLENILSQFFEFYSLFDFNNKAISLNEARTVMKSDHSALFIVNPFEPLLNVSKNVSLEEVERFQFAAKNGAWVMDSKDKTSDGSSWGLLNLFKTNKSSEVRPHMFFKSRLVEVSDLFDGNEDREVIHYQNKEIQDQVQSIRRTTRNQIENLKAGRISSKARKS